MVIIAQNSAFLVIQQCVCGRRPSPVEKRAEHIFVLAPILVYLYITMFIHNTNVCINVCLYSLIMCVSFGMFIWTSITSYMIECEVWYAIMIYKFGHN